ncbi:MAG: transcriptional repressor [Verrucomicrobiota bacterium]|nr:transcriptional repressor [Verrucomicrobiota bacterium]
MIRRTRQRDAILQVFEETGRPLAPGELHQLALKYCSDIGLRTVYRNIRDLVTEGKLVGVDYPGQPLRYELVSDKGHHPHFICRGCNKLYQIDVALPEFEVKAPAGFVIEGEEIVFFGRCPKCAGKKGGAKGAVRAPLAEGTSRLIRSKRKS